MTNILAIKILKEMQEGIKATGNLTKDVEALDLAIKALEGTAQEVPVQEQLEINFSPSTGKKLHEICPNCWVKNKPYKCEFDKCPGYKLLSIESTKEK